MCKHSLSRKKGGVTLSQAVSKEDAPPRLRPRRVSRFLTGPTSSLLLNSAQAPPAVARLGGPPRFPVHSLALAGASSVGTRGPTPQTGGSPHTPPGGHSGGGGGGRKNVSGRALHTQEGAFCGALGICWRPLGGGG